MRVSWSAYLVAWILPTLNLYALAESKCLGAVRGLNIPTFNKGKEISLLYQFTVKIDAPIFQYIHRICG